MQEKALCCSGFENMHRARRITANHCVFKGVVGNMRPCYATSKPEFVQSNMHYYADG